MAESAPKITVKLGPIIGKVTHDSARVLIELDSNDQISCNLTSLDGKIIKCTLLPEHGRPTIFIFKGLQPKTKYTVTLDHVPDLQGSFTTTREDSDNPGNLRIGVVSCNEISKGLVKTPQQDLWNDLANRVRKNELDYVLHIGDQWYLDMGDNNSVNEPYQVCKGILDSMPRDKWEAEIPRLLEIIRNQVRKTWSHRATAYVLANIPNLTILDDHEVRDDWGTRPEDYTKDTPKCDYFYGQLARQVYYEYQRQLREDIDWNNLDKLKCEYYDEILNGVGILFTDYRGSRSWFREPEVEKLHLGRNQLEWIKQLFSPGGKFDNVNSVLFVNSTPMIFLDTAYTKLAALAEDDYVEMWAYTNTKEITTILDIMMKWKNQSEGRVVTLISGDILIGGHTDIFFEGNGAFKQFTTSAINNTVLSKFQNMVLKFFEARSGKLGDGYSFEHHDWTKYNNYGLVTIENHQGASLVNCSLVKGEPQGITTDKKPFSNTDWTNQKYCNLF